MNRHFVSARSTLTRHLIEFFESYLIGLFTWGDVTLRSAEKAEKIPGHRQLDKEVAIVDFAGYSIMVSSPEEHPPLGQIMLFSLDHGILAQGPIDTATWARVAEAIKAPRVKDNFDVA